MSSIFYKYEQFDAGLNRETRETPIKDRKISHPSWPCGLWDIHTIQPQCKKKKFVWKQQQKFKIRWCHVCVWLLCWFKLLTNKMIRYDPSTSLPTPSTFEFPFQPYQIQHDFMVNLYSVLENREIGIFESPTGKHTNWNVNKQFRLILFHVLVEF